MQFMTISYFIEQKKENRNCHCKKKKKKIFLEENTYLLNTMAAIQTKRSQVIQSLAFMLLPQ